MIAAKPAFSRRNMTALRFGSQGFMEIAETGNFRMPTIISAQNEGAAISAAVARLREGRAVAIPTETVYGLAADATDGEAVASIFQLKGRPSFNPLICHVDGLLMADELGKLSPVARRLATQFWPGPLTLVVPCRQDSGVHDLVTAGLGTVGLRCPKGIARQIISALGRPLAAPSANRSGRISPTTAKHVAEEFADTDLLIIDQGSSPVGVESTIVRVDGEMLTQLRPGAITSAEIEAVAGVPVHYPERNAGIQGPGMMTSHYAPNAAVRLNCNDCEAGEAWLNFGNRPVPTAAGVSLNLSVKSNLTEAAANLYAFLKQLDKTGASAICVAPIPEEDLGIAINDRLRRAAAPRVEESE
jgi:L-threonylcarbamoyladenylate synthase